MEIYTNLDEMPDTYNDIVLTYDKAFLKVRMEKSPLTPWEDEFGVAISIEENKKDNSIHFLFLAYDGPHIVSDKDLIVKSVSEGFELFYNIKEQSIYEFRLLYLEPSYIYSYTKQLIDKLNYDQIKSVSEKHLNKFESNLGIKIKMIQNGNSKGLQIIRLIKGLDTSNPEKQFFIGKISMQGNSVVIKDENDNIKSLMSSENLNIETELIENKNHWYFTK